MQFARPDAIASKFNVPTAYDINDFLARKDIDAVGFYLNSDLIGNKESYGARATAFDRYSLDLSGPQDRQPDRIG